MTQIYIKNISGSVFKIPFKLRTPYEVQSKINGVVGIGKRKFIPANVAVWLDLDRLETFEHRKEIVVTRKKVRVPRVAIKPISVQQVTKPKFVKPDKVAVTKDREKGGS